MLSYVRLHKIYGPFKGIIHIGSHRMQERQRYIESGVSNIIWIDANPRIVRCNKPLLGPNEKIFQYAISDQDNIIYNFKITNNGQSSSILDLDRHKHHHPNVHVVNTIDVQSKRMDSLLLENNIDIDQYDFVNIDIQGVELQALKGFGDILHQIKYIYTEVNTGYVYKDCCLLPEIDEYLLKFNFIRYDTVITDCEWGDAFYVKN